MSHNRKNAKCNIIAMLAKAQKNNKNESGMTLVEITVATIALSIVVLAAGTVYVSGVREMQRITDEARAQIEASAALDHIYKNLMGAMNIVSITAHAIDVDTDNPALGPRIRYVYNATQKILYAFYGSGATWTPEKVANNITAVTFARPLQAVTAENPEAINNYVTVEITAQKGRMQRTFSTGVVLRGMNPS